MFDQRSHLTEVGAGLQLAPNAVRLAHRLGMQPTLLARAVPIEAIEIRSWGGRPIARTALGGASEALFGTPYYTICRAHLQEGLLDLASPARIRLGHRLRRIVHADDGVLLEFHNGASHVADLVVGADGIHSTVREQLSGDAPVHSGLGVFRGLVPMARLPSRAREPLVRVWLGSGRHFVCYPVSSGDLMSFAGIVPWHDPTSRASACHPAELVGAFDGWHAPVCAVTEAADMVHRWVLRDRDVLARWTADRLTVLGDAAHAMLPFIAQGANQAIEDAVALASCVADASRDQVPDRIARYAARRAPRTAAVQRESRHLADAMHLPDGALQRVRDHEMNRYSGLEQRSWIYGR